MADGRPVFPPKPERPEETDCCGSGCSPCVFDVYEANLKRWERQCRDIRENPSSERADGVERESFLSEIRYKPFRLKDVQIHTCNTKIFTFQAAVLAGSSTEESGAETIPVREALGLKRGQHVIMKGHTREGVNISRAYTPVRHRLGEMDLLVRLYPDGAMSRHLATLCPGDLAHFRGPYGAPPYRANTYRRVLMLCAGTGVAPMFSLAEGIVADESDETFVRLLFCVRTLDDILLRDQLRALADNWNFTVQFHVSDCGGAANAGLARYGETVRYGRLDRDALSGELNGADGVLVLVCGTETFNTDMTEYAVALGVQQSNIYVF